MLFAVKDNVFNKLELSHMGYDNFYLMECCSCLKSK